ncbi:MAG TPA: hypothetical protein VN613_06010 [Gemmatimonadaceae bacterium]|nr:hypothetical protein [Gemmatimonadaceae bacterium]
MSDGIFSEAQRTASRVRVIDSGPGYTHTEVTAPLDHRNGYRVTVSWDEETSEWIAVVTGMKVQTEEFAYADTPMGAVCELVCSLSCLIDALQEPLPPPAPVTIHPIEP